MLLLRARSAPLPPTGLGAAAAAALPPGARGVAPHARGGGARGHGAGVHAPLLLLYLLVLVELLLLLLELLLLELLLLSQQGVCAAWPRVAPAAALSAHGADPKAAALCRC